MLRLILLTIRLFKDNGWDDTPGWVEYLFDSARLLGLEPQVLENIAITYRDDDKALHHIWQAQHGMGILV